MKASIRNVDVKSAAFWRAAFWIAWTVLLIAKIALATTLAPFGDEAWYWQESRHLDWGYSDLPPATAWLIAAGQALLGHSELAMRAPFLLLGAMVPLIVVRISRRMFGDGEGWCAGLLTLALPLTGTLGVLALPDVPLTFASALALDALERATRTRALRDFALLGIALALAWLSHYRAAMLMLTGIAFLIVAPRGRILWRERGLWLALAIALLGLLPIVIFNATYDGIALSFQFVERNPWAFHADALVQPLEQALVCTPLFYMLLLWAAWRCLSRLREGAPWDVLAVCSIVPITTYFLVGLFADDTRFRLHWPLPGYLPLLVALPVWLREFTARWRRLFQFVALTLLACGSLVAFAYLALAAMPGGSTALASMKAFPEHFVGWREAAAETRELLATRSDDMLVADNFMLAAELDFALGGARAIYALDQPINAKHGRAAQLALWQRDEAALRALAPSHVLLIAEPTARRERERAAWMRSLCARVMALTPVASLDLYDARKRYRWYEGAVGGASADCDLRW